MTEEERPRSGVVPATRPSHGPMALVTERTREEIAEHLAPKSAPAKTLIDVNQRRIERQGDDLVLTRAGMGPFLARAAVRIEVRDESTARRDVLLRPQRDPITPAGYLVGAALLLAPLYLGAATWVAFVAMAGLVSVGVSLARHRRSAYETDVLLTELRTELAPLALPVAEDAGPYRS